MDEVVIPLRKNDSGQPWGFKVEGGAEGGKSLYISQVSAKSVASLAGLRAGDAILSIGNCDVSRFTQAQLKEEMNRAGVEFLITLKRNAVSVQSSDGGGKQATSGVVAEPSMQFHENEAPYQAVDSVSSHKIEEELRASEADQGPRPSSVFDRRKQDRSSYQTTTGISYNRAYGRPM